MFFLGFLFALGYAVGCFVFIFMMLTALVDYRHSRVAASAGIRSETGPGGIPPRKLVIQRFAKSNEKAR